MGSESHPGLGHHRCQCYPGMRKQLCREDGGEDSGEWLDSLEQSCRKLEERQELGLFSAWFPTGVSKVLDVCCEFPLFCIQNQRTGLWALVLTFSSGFLV